MTTKHHKIGTTHYAYELIEVKITDTNMKRLVDNARKYGKGLKDNCLSDEIKGFISYVRGRYIRINESPDRSQRYLIYGHYLFIFNWNKRRLITVYDLPQCFHEEAKKLKDKIKGKKSREDVYDRPLSKVNESEQPKRKRKRKRNKQIHNK